MTRAAKAYRVQYEHPTQLLASTFLRAVATGDAALLWERLSRETRGLLEGRYAAQARIALHRAAGVSTEAVDARLAAVIGPLRDAVLAAAGGPERLLGLGVSAARRVDRETVFVLLLLEFGEERIVREDEWRPAHLLAFVHESREWFLDLGATADLSAEAELPDLLAEIR